LCCRMTRTEQKQQLRQRILKTLYVVTLKLFFGLVIPMKVTYLFFHTVQKQLLRKSPPMTFNKRDDVIVINRFNTHLMKKCTSLLIVFLVLTLSPLYAQDEAPTPGSFLQGWGFGVKAGINFSTMFGDVGDNGYLVFPHAGVVIDKDLNDQWRLSTEPQLSGEGQTLNGGYDRIIYLNLPFLGKYRVVDDFSLDGGIHVGVKVTETTKFSNGNTENRNRFKRIAPGFTAGGTYDVDEAWFIQFRTNLKLSDVVRKEGGDSEGSTILSFQVSVGHRFN
jgi:hypothetical protein